ncbi:hypothetical protein [Paenibacillus thalictri]|uniref:Uncharacterized protein n=1 Tax=Paenibacillus thalictri TaxID=2527873 RepID=A0A4Q9DH95_9BACL|nr:hypothetical protein [Paenibacillus thalictri]TBL70080.1 hypothetical protein EYB31_34280 [Paenibacillus thalictri]
MSEQMLQHIIDQLSQINDRLTHVETNMATKDDISNMATKDDISNMATKDDIAKLATKEDIAILPFIQQAVLETNETVKRIELTQERHSKIIDLLSARSIEHESILKQLR